MIISKIFKVTFITKKKKMNTNNIFDSKLTQKRHFPLSKLKRGKQNHFQDILGGLLLKKSVANIYILNDTHRDPFILMT